ncbi:hypothetical protein BGZ99_006405 [Dissophora globulifera]|uniref:BTB domain-containing protein n=1 Tax=Dissophora globulifera TaxID=979702 RepID=A0A9P6UR82_9FUNG|nr:hypothetical protein BGZ99_006405 [Dissophora globulifera]
MGAGLSTEDSSHRLHRVGAHRAIMRQWPAFALLLQNFTRPGDDPIVHKLIGIDPEIMQLIVNFIYLGQIEGPGYTGIVDWRRLFQLAHRFQIAPLAEIAMENMCKEIRLQDALPTLFLWAYQHPDYEERLLTFALEYGKNVSASSLHASLEPYRDHPQFLRIYSRLCASHSGF